MPRLVIRAALRRSRHRPNLGPNLETGWRIAASDQRIASRAMWRTISVHITRTDQWRTTSTEHLA
jgi:hypothetical protein